MPSSDRQSAQPDPTGDGNTGAVAAESLELKIDGRVAVARLQGDIDLSVSGEIAELGARALAAPQVSELVVDLSSVTFVDSTGLGALVELHNGALAVGKHLTLCGTPPSVARLLEMTNLAGLFGLADPTVPPHGRPD
jgi:anti-sigma B factor antagonist